LLGVLFLIGKTGGRAIDGPWRGDFKALSGARTLGQWEVGAEACDLPFQFFGFTECAEVEGSAGMGPWVSDLIAIGSAQPLIRTPTRATA